MTQPAGLKELTQLLARLPGLGPRSARRVLLMLLKNKKDLMQPLAQAMADVARDIKECPICGNWDVLAPCQVCQDPKRDPHHLCVVETVADLWALERTISYRGHFHVLGGTLSALDGRRPEDLRIPQLIDRLRSQPIQEIILGLNATVDGQTTMFYLADRLKEFPVKVTALAHGVPLGGELDYLDEGTISTALMARRPVT